MAEERSTGQEVAETGGSTPAPRSENTIQLDAVTFLDVTGLTEEQKQQLVVEYSKGMIDVNKKAIELKVDVGALDAALDTMARQTREITEDGSAVTMTHSQSNTLGRTEIVMGNTDTAKSGKLTRSQTGEADRSVAYIVLAALAIIVVGVVLSKAFG